MTGVTISPKNNNLEVGATRQLNVEIEPNNINTDVTFISDNEDVATIDENGLVTAISEGAAEITVDADGVTDTSTVNVTSPDEGDD